MGSVRLGELELETLRFLAEHAPITVGEMYSEFAEPRGLARSTIATVMDHLLKKGYLMRAQGEDGVFRYTPKVAQQTVLKNLVRSFVDKTLGGRVAPLMAYLNEAQDFTDEEEAQLQQLLDRLHAQRETKKP